MSNEEKLGILQRSLEKAMLKALESLGDQAKELSFFATTEEAEVVKSEAA